jgi:hypothetical protein
VEELEAQGQEPPVDKGAERPVVADKEAEEAEDKKYLVTKI